MNRIPSILSFALIAVLFALACTKKYTKPADVPPTTYNGGGPTGFPTQSMNQLFKELRSTPEKQCLTAGILQTITFSQGTRLTFYPNSFKDASGNIITSGTVCIEMVEMYKPGDMIANRATTMTADGQLLRSGGQVSINATKEGKALYANKYGIAFPQPTPSAEPMSLFYGTTSNKDSVVTWNTANTTLPGTTTPGTIVDTSMSGIHSLPFYIFDSCTSFGFTNCDQIHSDTRPRTQVNFVMPDASYEKGTGVYLILTDINSVVAAYIYSSSTNTYNIGSDHFLHKVPIGMHTKVVVMSKKNEEYYYFEQSGLEVWDGMTIKPTMTKQSLDYIKAKLSAL